LLASIVCALRSTWCLVEGGAQACISVDGVPRQFISLASHAFTNIYYPLVCADVLVVTEGEIAGTDCRNWWDVTLLARSALRCLEG
jgi:hypothetical protein